MEERQLDINRNRQQQKGKSYKSMMIGGREGQAGKEDNSLDRSHT